MKKNQLITGILVLSSLIACKKNVEPTTPVEEPVVAVENTPKTYAELSIKEGGHWKGREYLEGTFKNVNSLKVPAEHTDHSWFIRYEGPGWESNKIGYRLYLDWRNAIDIFGKVTDTMVLSKVGQDGFDSYHKPQAWGSDILKVGKGLGIGSIGRYVNKEVVHFKEVDSTFAKVENLEHQSVVKVNYFGWKTNNQKTNLTSTLSISADERYTKHTIQNSEGLEGICTGIVKLNNLPLIQKDSDNKKWAYIATYGEQTLIPDDLGMAIFYEVETVASTFEGEHDHLIQFKPTKNEISFYFLGAWEQEVNGIKTQEEFIIYLNDKLNELNASNKLK
ncbi:DUF4861 domain-containing protein [Flavobacterium jejuense]|uniref:DUF4861 domain-containing protein n=1 Tax=Flavobacterium jejuense TaxID=1544455 RepID=A0ABX0IPS9_9FLAO|nr:DUF4861 family protein [Flavobacterium jejuense]NHN25820.1 DUF4861 domain-containing protein [Flavobacterium jejuense]